MTEADTPADEREWFARQLGRSERHAAKLRAAGWTPTRTLVNIPGVHVPDASAEDRILSVPLHLIDDVVEAQRARVNRAAAESTRERMRELNLAAMIAFEVDRARRAGFISG